MNLIFPLLDFVNKTVDFIGTETEIAILKSEGQCIASRQREHLRNVPVASPAFSARGSAADGTSAADSTFGTVMVAVRRNWYNKSGNV